MRKVRPYWDQANRYLGVLSGRFAFCGPLFVQIGITDLCNFKCVYCPSHFAQVDPSENFGAGRMQHLAHRKNPSTMPLDLYRRVLDDLVKMGCRRVTLAGFGEPFLHKSIMDIIEFSRHRVQLHIVSNGSLITPERADEIVGRLTSLNVSMDAASEEVHDRIHQANKPVFKGILETLQRIRQGQRSRGTDLPQLSLSSVLCHDNYMEIEELFRMAAALDIPRVDFSMVGTIPQTKHLRLLNEDLESRPFQKMVSRVEELAVREGIQTNLFSMLTATEAGGQRTKNIYREMPCYVGWFFLRILPNGDVHPCCGCDTVLGNVNREPLGKIWKNRDYAAFRTQTRRLPERGGMLAGCKCYDCGHNLLNRSIHNKLHRKKGKKTP